MTFSRVDELERSASRRACVLDHGALIRVELLKALVCVVLLVCLVRRRHPQRPRCRILNLKNDAALDLSEQVAPGMGLVCSRQNGPRACWHGRNQEVRAQVQDILYLTLAGGEKSRVGH